MNEAPRTYRSYLLRLRLVDNAGRPVWRASLQEPGSDSVLHFNSLAELCVYLAKELGVDGSKEKGESNEER